MTEALRGHVAKLAPGSLLPSVREWTKALGVSPVTVQRALSQLAREGLLDPRPGVGTFVAAPLVARGPRDDSWQLSVLGPYYDAPDGRAFELPPPNHSDLGTGYLDRGLQPIELVSRAMRRCASRPHAWRRLQVEGLDELRQWFARELGGETSGSDVLVVPGGQAALSTALRALCPAGGTVITESPTYFGALAAMKALGLRAWPVAIDQEGVRPEALEAALAASSARVVYLQPQWANPTGASLSLQRRSAVLELCARAGAFVIEDDYAKDLGQTSAARAPMVHYGPGRVVYLRTLTKLTVPALRVAAIVARGPVFARLRAMRAAEDMFLSGILQEVALEVVTSHGWQAHKHAVRVAIEARRALAVSAIRERIVGARVAHAPDGGFSLWVELPEGVEEHAFVRAALAAGVRVNEGNAWFPAEKTGEFVRLSVAGCSIDELDRGITTLARVAKSLQKARSREADVRSRLSSRSSRS